MYEILNEIIVISEGSVITTEMGSINRGNIVWFIQANQAKRLEKEINLLVDEAYTILDQAETNYDEITLLIEEQKAVDEKV